MGICAAGIGECARKHHNVAFIYRLVCSGIGRGSNVVDGDNDRIAARATVQNIVCDGSVIGLIDRVHRRQERGRTQDDDDRDDDHVDPAGLTSRHK